MTTRFRCPLSEMLLPPYSCKPRVDVTLRSVEHPALKRTASFWRPAFEEQADAKKTLIMLDGELWEVI